jgi:hypothetical protein
MRQSFEQLTGWNEVCSLGVARFQRVVVLIIYFLQGAKKASLKTYQTQDILHWMN